MVKTESLLAKLVKRMQRHADPILKEESLSLSQRCWRSASLFFRNKNLCNAHVSTYLLFMKNANVSWNCNISVQILCFICGLLAAAFGLAASVLWLDGAKCFRVSGNVKWNNVQVFNLANNHFINSIQVSTTFRHKRKRRSAFPIRQFCFLTSQLGVAGKPQLKWNAAYTRVELRVKTLVLGAWP